MCSSALFLSMANNSRHFVGVGLEVLGPPHMDLGTILMEQSKQSSLSVSEDRACVVKGVALKSWLLVVYLYHKM